MPNYVVTEAPHFVIKDMELRAEEKRELFREYDTLLRSLLYSTANLEVMASCKEGNGLRKAAWSYYLPEDYLHFDNLQNGLRYIHLNKTNQPPAPVKTEGSFVQRRVDLIRVGGDKIMHNQNPRIMGWWKDVGEMDYGALIPSPHPIVFSQTDYRWKNLLQALGQYPDSSLRISINRLELKLPDVRYANQCLEVFWQTFAKKLPTTDIGDRTALYSQVVTNEPLYEAKIFFTGANSDAVRFAFLRDTDFEAFGLEVEQFPKSHFDHLSDELKGVIGRYFSLWHLEDLARLIIPPYTFTDALPNISHFVPKPFVVPSIDSNPTKDDGVLVGTLENGSPVYLPTDALTRHTFITGKTGVGKSTTIRNIVKQVYDQGIPILIVDPVKVDYESMVVDKLKCENKIIDFKNEDRWLQFNIFVPAPNITLYAHSTVVAKALSLLCPTTPVAYELWLSMIRKCYLEKLKEVTSTENDRSELNDIVLATITGAQLVNCPEIIPTYDDLNKSGLAWIKQLPGVGTEWLNDAIAYFERRFEIMQGSMLRWIFSPTDKQKSIFPLFQTTYLVELYHILDETEANAIFALIMALLFEYRLSEGPKDRCVHLTVVEELHRLAPANPRTFGKDVINSPEAEIGKLLARALGELRDRGEALIVSEQSSVKIFADAMINTVTRIIHGVSYGPDIENISQSLSLSSRERDHLSFLQVNQEYGYSEAIAMLPDLAQPLYLRIGRLV
jgi:hypothetical protein